MYTTHPFKACPDSITAVGQYSRAGLECRGLLEIQAIRSYPGGRNRRQDSARMLCQDLTEQDSGTERLLGAEGLLSHIELLLRAAWLQAST